MIRHEKSISAAEAKEYLKDKPEVNAFVKKFVSLTPEKAKELREKIEGLNLIQLNEKHISKLIDILPSDKESLNKVSSEMNLSEDDTNKILQTIKEYI